MTAQIYNALPSLLTKMENTILSHELVRSISSNNEYSEGWYFYLTLVSEVKLVFYLELEYQLAYREFLLRCLEICRAYDRLIVVQTSPSEVSILYQKFKDSQLQDSDDTDSN